MCRAPPLQDSPCCVWWWCTCCGCRYLMWWMYTLSTSAPPCARASSCPSTMASPSCLLPSASSSASWPASSSCLWDEPSRFIIPDSNKEGLKEVFFFSLSLVCDHHTFDIYSSAVWRRDSVDNCVTAVVWRSRALCSRIKTIRSIFGVWKKWIEPSWFSCGWWDVFLQAWAHGVYCICCMIAHASLFKSVECWEEDFAYAWLLLCAAS